MINKKTIYLVEGPCEDKLVRALKEKPELIAPGRSHVFNVIQKVLPINKLIPEELLSPDTKVDSWGFFTSVGYRVTGKVSVTFEDPEREYTFTKSYVQATERRNNGEE